MRALRSRPTRCLRARARVAWVFGRSLLKRLDCNERKQEARDALSRRAAAIVRERSLRGERSEVGVSQVLVSQEGSCVRGSDTRRFLCQRSEVLVR